LSSTAFADPLYQTSWPQWPTPGGIEIRNGLGPGIRGTAFEVSETFDVTHVGAALDWDNLNTSVRFEIWTYTNGVFGTRLAQTTASFPGDGMSDKRTPLSLTLAPGTYVLQVHATATPTPRIRAYFEDELPWSPPGMPAITVLDGMGNRNAGNAIVVGMILDGDVACSDSDGDGQDDASCGGTDCDDSDALVFSGATERCNGLDDDCDGTPDEGAPDADTDGVCDAFDICQGDDATGDTDGDAVCDELDVCEGDDATGDSDADLVCDDVDLCQGDDATGDDDVDGVCLDLDVCLGDDATGDTDTDGTCDDLDLCTGDDSLGDVDTDGICDVPRITMVGACPGTFDVVMEHFTPGGRWGIATTDAPTTQVIPAGACAGITQELGVGFRKRAGGVAPSGAFTIRATLTNAAQCPVAMQAIDFDACLMSNLEPFQLAP
jgi:hypothetical protein